MEQITDPIYSESKPNYSKQFSFHGTGQEYFGISIVNFFMCIITIGFYYPWARAKTKQYLFGHMEMEGSRFKFHGTGKEIFLGFIKALGILLALFLIVAFFPKIGPFIYLIAITVLAPIVVHGAMRYNTSRTSWRGIHLGYRGVQNELMSLYIKGVLLTIVTFGIYSSWLINDLRKYIFNNTRFGNIKFSYDADGTAFFLLNLKGILLTIVTLGIYSFWFAKERFDFLVKHITLHQDEKVMKIRSHFSVGDYFSLTIVNVLLLFITLGFAYPWVVVRSINFIVKSAEAIGDIDLNTISQTEAEYRDAFGEDMMDVVDFGIF